MNIKMKCTPITANSLNDRIDHSLPSSDLLDNFLQYTKQLDLETEDTSALLYYAMLSLGRVTRGSTAVQQFSQLFKDLGNEVCADIVYSGQYREQDLAFYWSTSADLSHLFEPSTISSVEVFSSSENTRQITKTLMSDEWTDYTFHEVDKISTEKKPRKWHLYKLENATIAYDTAEFVVLDDHGNPVLDLCSANYMHVYFTPMFQKWYFSDGQSDSNNDPSVRLDDALMIQDLIRRPNFCHWLLDQLPRTRHLEDSQNILVYKLAPFMKNMLEIMGINSDRIHELGERAVIQAGRLTIESSMAKNFCHPCQDASRELIDYIENSLSPADTGTGTGTGVKNDRAVTRTSSNAVPTRRHVYLSRNRYTGRRISNEDDLLGILDRYDFHTIYPEELSIQDQIRLFRNAEVIVAPHGASLASIIFCKKVTLIEIFNQNYGTPTFYIIAKLLGFEYQHILGNNALLSPEEKQSVGMSNLQYEDMEADLEKLTECLDKLFPDYPFKKVESTGVNTEQGFFQRIKARLL